MTAPAIQFATTGRGSANQAAKRLVSQEDTHVEELGDGVERPEVRPLLVKLLAERVLEVQDPDAALSLIVPGRSAR